MGDGMICANQLKSVYTYTGTDVCDGWQGISLEECKAKCTNNEIPNDECPRKNVKCSFVQYNHNLGCHLADESCKPTKGDSRYSLLGKS